MRFNPGLEIGQIIENAELCEIFKCSNMGGMRRSLETNTLVLISDTTKDLYHDRWVDGTLYYTGMGKKGDQKLNNQNGTLYNIRTNGVDPHLFEVFNVGKYTYCGRVKLAGEPFMEIQKDEDGRDRKVWIFPLKLVSETERPFNQLVGKKIEHKSFGSGIIVDVEDDILVVNFDNYGTKTLLLGLCEKEHLISIIE